jgi:hypothetical protein
MNWTFLISFFCINHINLNNHIKTRYILEGFVRIL